MQVEPRKSTDELANEFAVTNGDYYSNTFARLGEARNNPFTFNWSPRSSGRRGSRAAACEVYRGTSPIVSIGVRPLLFPRHEPRD